VCVSVLQYFLCALDEEVMLCMIPRNQVRVVEPAHAEFSTPQVFQERRSTQ
jgi:hypothetical protein